MGWSRFALTVFLPFALGYFLSYLFRSVNAVIAPDLVADFGLGAADLGLLTACYFLSFSAFQIPLGILLDRFGPRRVQVGLFLVAGLGALIFSVGSSVGELAVGRAVIGLGVSGGLMSAFTAIALCLPPARWPLVNSCLMGAGGLGAVAATAPVETLLHFSSWRTLFLGLAGACLVTSALIFRVTPDHARPLASASLGRILQGCLRVFRNRLFWRLAPVTLMANGAGMAIQGLWAGPWLRDVAGFDRSGVAHGLMTMAAFMAVGFVLAGAVADLLIRWGLEASRIMATGILSFLVVQLLFVLEIAPGSWWTLALFGLLCNFHILAYPILSRHFPAEYMGRANTGLNLMVFVAAFAFQYATGALLDLWPGTTPGTYGTQGYRWAFGGVLVLEALAWAWLLWGVRREVSPR
jgi:MFS family permease